MKYVVLNYFKNFNLGLYDANKEYVSSQIYIKNVTWQKEYHSYEQYLIENKQHLEQMVFEVQRCDDFQDDVIVLLHVVRKQEIVYDYIGYFTIDDQHIRKIEEYWCERK